MKNFINKFRRHYLLNKKNHQMVAHIQSSFEDKMKADKDMLSALHENISSLKDEINHLKETSKNTEDLLNHISRVQGDTYNILNHTLTQNQRRINEILIRDERYYQDIMLHLPKFDEHVADNIMLETQYPIAYESDDHLFPWGTMNDNTRSPKFVKRSEQILNKDQLKVLDLGCAGGGMVYEFILSGHIAFGLEGSDFSQKANRASWRLIPNALATSNITKEFYLKNKSDQSLIQFDLITMWEVFEHIKEDQFKGIFTNIHNHLHDDGLFVGSIACFEDVDPKTGAVYHVTLHDKAWWKETFKSYGFDMLDESPYHNYDYPRGTLNGLFDSSDYNANPDIGFHFVAKKII